jgi:hypothetical protein
LVNGFNQLWPKTSGLLAHFGAEFKDREQDGEGITERFEVEEKSRLDCSYAQHER